MKSSPISGVEAKPEGGQLVAQSFQNGKIESLVLFLGL